MWKCIVIWRRIDLARNCKLIPNFSWGLVEPWNFPGGEFWSERHLSKEIDPGKDYRTSAHTTRGRGIQSGGRLRNKIPLARAERNQWTMAMALKLDSYPAVRPPGSSRYREPSPLLNQSPLGDQDHHHHQAQDEKVSGAWVSLECSRVQDVARQHVLWATRSWEVSWEIDMCSQSYFYSALLDSWQLKMLGYPSTPPHIPSHPLKGTLHPNSQASQHVSLCGLYEQLMGDEY